MVLFDMCNLCKVEQSVGSGSGKSVMLHNSLNPIKSRRGPNGCFCVFCAGWPAVGCGVACSEVKLKHTNTFLLKLLLWSEGF